MPDLQVFRKWNTDLGLLQSVRGLFTYDPPTDDRATGVIYGEGRSWSTAFRTLGPRLLANLKDLTGVSYEIVAFQAYRNGAGCDWHQDSPFDAQAILSLGVTRTFGVRKLDGSALSLIPVGHGDLVVMPSGFQAEWQHCVPVEDVEGERCSLVFRTVER